MTTPKGCGFLISNELKGTAEHNLGLLPAEYQKKGWLSNRYYACNYIWQAIESSREPVLVDLKHCVFRSPGKYFPTLWKALIARPWNEFSYNSLSYNVSVNLPALACFSMR